MAVSTIPRGRFGVHYFPDTLHYRENDLRAWLPELSSIGAEWLVLQAEAERAIPESFLKGIIDAGIEPILQFNISLDQPLNLDEIKPLLAAYRDWGVHYVVFYDRPNRRVAWKPADWLQANLVQRFLERFVPLAENALEHNLIPVFPPLEPGGDYWDTAFLRVALQTLLKQEKVGLLEKMVIGAYAAAGERPLTWGIGGPERWVRARPYFTPEGEQDEKGFYIFDWYRAISEAVLGVELPIMLFGSGSPGAAALAVMEGSVVSQLKEEEHVQRNISMIKLVHDEVEPPFIEKLPPAVIACNFWALGSASQSNSSTGMAEQYESVQTPFHLWYRKDGTTSPVVGFLRQWQGDRVKVQATEKPSIASEKREDTTIKDRPAKKEEKLTPIKPLWEMPMNTLDKQVVSKTHPIAAYLFIPLNEQGSMEFDIAPISPFIKKHNLTVGFSLDEAALAAQVIILDYQHNFPLEAMERLRSLGCKVVRICGSGMEIAQFLSSL